MGSLLGQAFALKWSFSFLIAGLCAFEEYSPLYLKQLGFSASQIGFTSLMGIPMLLAPLIGLLADGFRARKLVLVILLLVLVALYLAPLLPLVAPIGKCNEAVETSKTSLPNYTNDTKVSYWKKGFHFRNLTQDSSQSESNHKSNLTAVWRFSVPSIHHNNLDLMNQNQTATKQLKENTYLTWTSLIFVYIVAIRGMFEIVKRSIVTLYNVATMTHLKNKKANFGAYRCWGQIGGIFLFFAVGVTVTLTKLTYCTSVSYGYYVACFWSSFTPIMALLVLPWITFEYLEHRVIDRSDVRSVIFQCHYLVVLLVTIFLGCCFSFQQYWLNWYIAELSGSPVVMMVAGIIRRSSVAICYRWSGVIINKLGDLPTIALGLFIGVLSLLALSFLKIPWLVVVIGIPLSAAYVLSYSALNVHFSKAGSKASSATVLGLADAVFSIGREAGSTSMGALFTAIGSRATLRYYASGLAVILLSFIAYLIFRREHLDKYEKLPDIDSGDER